MCFYTKGFGEGCQVKVTSTEPIDNRQLGLSTKNNCQLTIVQADYIVQEHNHLIEEPYKKWFYKQLYRVGEHGFRRAASLAKEGNSPKRLFASILKQTRTN